MTFENLNLIKPLTGTLSKKGYLQPTPIQEKAIPYILQGRDIFGSAQTGTGKTAAFALPILQLLDAKKGSAHRSIIKALVLAPTRELAMQINESFCAYGNNLGFRHAVVYGGVKQYGQTNALKKGIDILVATPGRLLDLIQQGYVKLNHVEYFVLDEADRMLDMGFIGDIKKIIAKLPAKRQTIFFSATAPFEIKKLADTLLCNPVSVNVAPVSSASPFVKQLVYYVQRENKKPLLRHVLKDDAIKNVLVFTRTKRGADKVVKDLNFNGIKAVAIHGDKSQNAREKALKGFKNRTIRVLVATDIASRGIDVDKLTHVINFELPEQAETYVNRIGRTGRAGATGIALSFCSAEERTYLRSISKLINKNIEGVTEHPFLYNNLNGNGNITHHEMKKKPFRFKQRNRQRRRFNNSR